MVCLPFIAHHTRFAFLKWKCFVMYVHDMLLNCREIRLAVVSVSLRPLVKMLYFASVFSFNTKMLEYIISIKLTRLSEYLFALWTSCVKPITHVLQHDLRMIQRNL